MNKHEKEVKEKWSHTEAYQEYLSKKELPDQKKLMAIFIEIGKNKDLEVDNKIIQDLIRRLQNFITENYYTCTKDILLNLGKMYVEDTRFMENIDKASGTGTAKFTSKAIEYYCNN